MAERLIQLPAILGLPAGSLAGTEGIFECPLGLKYKELHVTYIEGATAGLATTIIGDITILRNDIIQRIHAATDLDRLNSLNGTQYSVASQTAGTAGVDREQIVPIYFAEPWRTLQSQRDALSWNVDPSQGWNSFQVKVKLAANMSATGSMVLHAVVEDTLNVPAKNQAFNIKKVYRTTMTASGPNNEYGPANFPNRQGDFYQTILFKQPSGTGVIQYVTIRQNGASGLPLLEKVSQYQNIGFLVGRGMNPSTSQVAGAYGFDAVFDSADPIQYAIPASQNGLWVKLEYSAAAAGTGNVFATFERLGLPD